MRFAVTDIETTGSQPSGNSITEVAVVITDGVREIERFHSLVRPDHPIPLHIERLTGISNDMVEDAPAFSEIAEELHAFLESSIFVAHNVGFDFAFLKAAFAELGYTMPTHRLCTVRISRKLHPGLQSYSLGRLCNHFGVSNRNAHRALSDTLATVELFHRFISEDEQGVIQGMLGKQALEQWLPPALDPACFNALPEAPGVYYFENASGTYLYIGMSANIKKRVRQHFSGLMASERRQTFLREITHISVQATGTELIAALLEDAEIRRHCPPFNRAQKRRVKVYTIASYEDRAGYLRLTVSQMQGESESPTFASPAVARDWLLKQARNHGVALALCGLATGGTLPSPERSNEQVKALLSACRPDGELQFIRGVGRSHDERSMVVLRGGTLLGYGFYSADAHISNDADMEAMLIRLPFSEMTASILQRYGTVYGVVQGSGVTG